MKYGSENHPWVRGLRPDPDQPFYPHTDPTQNPVMAGSATLPRRLCFSRLSNYDKNADDIVFTREDIRCIHLRESDPIGKNVFQQMRFLYNLAYFHK